jgi:hypothetical protein
MINRARVIWIALGAMLVAEGCDRPTGAREAPTDTEKVVNVDGIADSEDLY